ncbi:hypothetical protein [Nostoc sp.]|uniref:hypothetical protein n=1 Tax=Nostoc sp. TaxID=1180 RepID=UPI002FF606FF
MKKVFALIEKESAKFAQLPFFEFLGNKSIALIQRLSFAAYFALFIMGYGNLNKFVSLEEPKVNPIQYIFNKQIREQENHWIWFLKDLEDLDLNRFLNFTDSLKLNLSDQIVICRQIIYELYRLTFQVNPIYKLVAIESIESISNIFFSITAPVTQELKALTNREYPYFVNPHLLAENDHSVHSYETKEFIGSMHLAEEICKQACELVNKIFELFTALVDMLVNFAEKYKIKQLLTQSFGGSDSTQLPCAILLQSGFKSPYVTLFSTRRCA